MQKDASKALKEHYKEKHPTHTVGNPLMYFRYLASKHQEGNESQLNECEKVPSPERTREISPEREVEKPSSPQHPTSSGADVTLYHCNNCEFSHKSVVVMHVHYQKSHPEEAVSIDTIKQMARVKTLTRSQTAFDKSSNSVMEKSLPTESNMESQKPSKDKKAKKRIKLILRTPRPNPEVFSSHSESPTAVTEESSENRSKRKRFPTNQSKEMYSDMASLSSSSPKTLFNCRVCSYSSTNITSVVGHHNTKHYGHEPTDAEEIASYSVEVQRKKLRIHVSPSTKPSDSGAFKQVDDCSVNEHLHQKGTAGGASMMNSNPYTCPENLFYCQKCNFGNPTVKGVLNHQSKAHKNLKVERECILKHTALICDQIEKSKSSDSTVHLPLPIINDDKQELLFCHFCNYRSNAVDGVLKHYCNRHPHFRTKSEQIRLYSSMLLEKIAKAHLTPANQGVKHAPLRGKEDKKKNSKEHCKVSEPSAIASQTQRALKCHRCPYKTQHVYLLKRHVWQIHRANRTVTEVLRMCYKQGVIEAGYHCEMCVFSHKTADAVYDHYIENHPKRPSLEYVITRLYVGPDSIKGKRKKPQVMQTDILSDVDVTDDSLPSQSSGNNDTKVYSCKACSFKSDSVMNMTNHYRAVHPWSVKEDGSVLDVIHSRKPGTSRQFEDQSDMQVPVEAYQEPLEFDDSVDSSDGVTKSSKKLKCQYCSGRFQSPRHLRIHIRLEHHEDGIEKSNELEEEQTHTQTRVHVFKCPHCTYVNTNYHGILTHCQMRHPDLESRADSLHMDGDHLNNMEDCLKKRGQGLRLSGYMCETCPLIYATLEKLNKHCKKNHNETVADTVPAMLKPPPNSSSVLKKTHVKIRTNHGFMSKASLLRRKKYKVIKCLHCAYKSTTKIGLDRHVLLHHSDTSVAKDVEPPYKCALCPNTYFRKKRLGSHYATKHGKESVTKYFLPLNKQVEKKPWPNSQDILLAQQQGNSAEGSVSNTTAGENKVLVFLCPYCPYVNASFHGILTHCQMRHPDFTARADELKAEEVLTTSMIGCSKGRNFNARGFRCKKCTQVLATMKKLKIHLERNHGQSEATASKLIVKIKTTKSQPDYEFQQSVLEAFALKSETSAGSIAETDLTHQIETPGMNQSNTTIAKNMAGLYKCHICPYTACFRRYLQSHYRKYHKIDVLTTFKLLQKYNKRKLRKDSILMEAQLEEIAAVKCKMCPNSMFGSSELLLDHYRTVHNSDQILDFIILSRGSKRTTGLYKCSHCNKQLNGIKKMCYHLDRHREWRKTSQKTRDAEDAKTMTSDIMMTPEDEPTEQGDLPMLETVEDLSKWNVAPVETSSPPTSPHSSPTKPTDLEQPEEDLIDEIPTCKQCGRTFMSLKGLRSHERSHEALAAIKKHTLPTTVSKNKINRYIVYKPGTTKPFVCSFCSYRTNVMVLWRRHFMKNHHDVLTDPNENEDQDEEGAESDTEPHNSSEEWSSFPELDEKSQMNKRSQYSEPPDVQRQLNQYNMMAQAGASSQATGKESMMLESSVLYCDLCNFNTEHLSSIRRHYLNRHGKKILKCKDCSFFTGLRKTLEMHMEMGHSTCQSEPTHQKDLCCPFCLYQTKNKNSMIDHIVLHREERLVPIEVRRPKLSRYLQGIVFRCHNCTYTCGSHENLHLHMMKHDDIKPYKCRLCFFDCTQLSDLEAHLSDKHQVVRNHELVGQVSLDQLEARVVRTPDYEQEPLSDSELLNSESHGIVKTEEMVTDSDEVPEETQAKHPAANAIIIKLEDGANRTEEGPENLLLDLQNENAKLNTLVQEKHKKDQQEHAVTDPADQSISESMEFEDCNSGQKERQTNEKVALSSDLMMISKGKMETEDGSSIGEIAENALSEIHKKVDQEEEAEIEQSIEERLDGESSITLADKKNVANIEEKKNPENNIKVHLDKDGLTHKPNCAQLKGSHKERSSVSLKNLCPYGEMPILEKEYLKREMDPTGCWNEEDQSDHHEQTHNKEVKTINEDNEDGCMDQGHEESDGIEKPHKLKGAPEVADGGNEDHCPVNTEDKQFTCEFCGRNLMNSSDLQHHVMRHGL
ncbi:zinc finger protein 462-like isoform X1 [Notolabrus celidotus]|uniref:zinc finger protein 462-like isoform X1 n=1 Tax=Notolabrus celidotus TaxID=1203425 RepID=UPI0014900350|nr:zinc finger protein 462-like isoform X1 [Notolabrus celidotus]